LAARALAAIVLLLEQTQAATMRPVIVAGIALVARIALIALIAIAPEQLVE
jgi:hypothetical protein